MAPRRSESSILTGSGLTAQVAPGQAEAAEVLAQAVGIVGRLLAGPRDAEQPAPGLRQRRRIQADAQDLVQLDPIEAVELGRLLLAEEARRQGCGRPRLRRGGVARRLGRRPAPRMALAIDLLGHL